jgi:hypothetical protein
MKEIGPALTMNAYFPIVTELIVNTSILFEVVLLDYRRSP